MDRNFRNREAAVRAALSTVKSEMLRAETVCVKLYQSLDMISVFEMRGNRRRLMARFGWRTA